MHNWSLIEMTWPHWKSQGLAWWGRLTDAEWTEIDGQREKLVERLMLKYGWTYDQAYQEIETRFSEFTSSAS